MSVFKNTVHDYGESSTPHGITYILQREQPWSHRLLWVAIVSIAVTVSIALSMNAYVGWKDNPILTSVSTTALPISKLRYPAISICGQGMAIDTLDRVMEEQFQTYLQEIGLSYQDLSPEDEASIRKKFDEETVPGLSISLSELTALMTAPDPNGAVGAKAVASAAAASVSRLRGGCRPGWASSTTQAVFAETFCYKVLAEPVTAEEGKRACSMEKAILLEFDSRGEVEDLQRLIDDGHLEVPEGIEDVWVSVDYVGSIGYVYTYNRLDAELMLGLRNTSLSAASASLEGNFNAPDCGTVRLPNLILNPTDCNTKHLAICTTFGGLSRAKRSTHLSKRKIDDYEDFYQRTYGCKLPLNDSQSWTAARSKRLTELGRRTKRQLKPPKFDVFLNPEKRTSQAELQDGLTEKFRSVFQSLNLTASYPRIFQVLWHSINPCFDIRNWTSDYRDEKSTIKRCIWKGVQVNCTAIFKTNPTDRGMCCTFNAMAAEEIYRETIFSTSVSKQQRVNLNASFEEANLPPEFQEGKSPLPEIGKHRGLTLILDSHTDLASPGTVGDDYEGFLTVINSRDQFPSVTERGFVIRPGHENLIGMGAISTIADPDIRDIPPYKRDCYFQDEFPLDLHRMYSQSACVFECKLKFGKSLNITAGCTPWFYPSSDAKMCDPWQTKAFVRAIFGNMGDGMCDYCLPDCVNTAYTSTVSATPLRRCDTKNIGLSLLCKFDQDLPHPKVWSEQVVAEYRNSYPVGDLPEFVREYELRNSRRAYLKPESLRKQAIFNALYKNHRDATYNAYEKDIAVVHFFFQEPTVFQFKRSLRMTWIDWISQLGGLLGLCIGFSFISVVEFIYWFTLRLGHRACCSKPSLSRVGPTGAIDPLLDNQTNYRSGSLPGSENRYLAPDTRKDDIQPVGGGSPETQNHVNNSSRVLLDTAEQVVGVGSRPLALEGLKHRTKAAARDQGGQLATGVGNYRNHTPRTEI